MNAINFLFVGILLIATNVHAAPTTSVEESNEVLMLKAVVERFKILALTIEEFSKLYADIMEQGPKVLKAVLEDPKVKEVDNDVMKGYMKDLQDYLDKYENTKEKDRKAHIFELVEEYSELTDKFDSEQHPTDYPPEAAIIEKSMEEHGINEIEKTVIAHFENFMKKFSAEVGVYIENLDEKEKLVEHEFIDWYEKLKAEKDVEKQISMFDNFLEEEDDED